MNVAVKLMGAVDTVAAVVLITQHPDLILQVVGWGLLVKGVISLLS